MRRPQRRYDWRRFDQAHDRLSALTGDEPDDEIIEAIVEYLINHDADHPGTVHLTIIHDVRLGSRDGPCPMAYDWYYKNIVGISTKERERAAQWCRDALRKGYTVYRCHSRRSGGYGCSLDTMRQRGVLFAMLRA